MHRALKYISALFTVFMVIVSPIFAAVSTGGGYSLHSQLNPTWWVSSGWSYTLQSGSAPLNKISTGGSYTLIGGAYRSGYTDTDNDGVADAEELLGLNGGDSNGDGIADFLQSYVTTVPGYDTTHPYGIEVLSPTCNTIVGLDDRSELSISDDVSYSYPVGLLEFELDCTTPGDSAIVRIYFDADYSATTSTWVFRKWQWSGWLSLNPQPTLWTHTFVTGPFAGSTITTATYTLTDGGINDADALSDARIVDPVGPWILVNNTSGGGGGGGGGGFSYLGQNNDTLDSAGDNDSASECVQNEEGNWYRMCSLTPADATFLDFAQNVACEWFIAQRDTPERYEFTKYAPRKEALAVALKMKKSQGKPISLVPQNRYSYHYDDVGQALIHTDWVPWVVETALANSMISSERKLFEPDRNITRAETYAMIMNAVCMETDTTETKWQKNIHITALKNGLTKREWTDFDSESPILRQELMVLASRAADWAEYSGGCDPKPAVCPRLDDYSIAPPVTSATESIPDISVDTFIQLPGTFVYLYDTDYHKVYSYIVRSGGIPDGVRQVYLRTFGGWKVTANRLSIRNLQGTYYDENRWLLPHEVVYVYLRKAE
jgi:hypothetical protein